MANTPEQIEIIHAPINRHIKVAAVAGSGKSYTMVRRILHLIESGASPDRILVLMFNRSAQEEFSEKIKLAIPSGPIPKVLTYHGLGTLVCREIDKRNNVTGWTLLVKEHMQRETAKKALKMAMDTVAPGSKQPSNQMVDEFSSFVDLVKSLASSPAKVIANGVYDSKATHYPEAFKIYEQIRIEKKQRFFADLIYDPICYIVSKKAFFTSMIGEFDFVLIDEYQDINLSSHILIDGVCGPKTKLTVVGDDDQTIYEFRGSSPSFLIDIFQQRFKNPLCYTLTRTFRYGHAVSMLANNVINNNASRIPKICVSADTAPYTAIAMYFEEFHGEKIIPVIRARQQEGYSLDDMVVLLRVFSSAPALEIALLSEKIHYHMEGHETIIESKEIKFLTAVALLAKNQLSKLKEWEAINNLTYLFNMPKIGIRFEVAKDVATAIVKGEDAQAVLKSHAGDIHEYTRGLASERIAVLMAVGQSENQTPLEVIDWYLQKTQYYSAMVTANGNDTKADEMEHTITAWAEFVRHAGGDEIDAMLSFYSLKQSTATSSLLITTVHRSKGLEWPVVILPDLRHNIFPYKTSAKDFSMESERRLFYVACTRAQRNLSLITQADRKYINALKSGTATPPLLDEKSKSDASVFLYEANIGLTGKVVEAIKTENKRVIAPAEVDTDLFNRYLTSINSVSRVENDL